MKPARRLDLGRRAYAGVLDEMRALVEERKAGHIPDTFVVVEHDEVVTVGRRIGAVQNLLDPSLPLVEVERGGDITWHGPGQLVVYPILLLGGADGDGERDLHKYLRHLEQAILDTLADYGLAATRRDNLTGAWVGDKKIASIGIAVRRWVTYHGLALNVAVDLQRFFTIRPCGLDPSVMTSLDRELGRPLTVAEVALPLVTHLARILGRTIS